MLTRSHRVVLPHFRTPPRGGRVCSNGSGKGATGVLTKAVVPSASAPITHVFVINLENENYADDLGRGVAGEVPERHAAQEGPAAHAVLRDRAREPRQLHRGDQRPGAEPGHAARLPEVHRTSSSTGTGAYGQAKGHGCVYPKSVQDDRRPAHRHGQDVEGVHGGHRRTPRRSRRRAGTPRSARATRRSSRPRPTCTRRVTTRSCTSTRSSTRRRARRRSSRSTRSPPISRRPRRRRTSSFITPNVCNDGHDAPCKDGRPGGLKSADAFLPKWVPKILASPAYKAGGMLVVTFDEAELGGDARRLDRVLPHAEVAERAEAGTERSGRRPGRCARSSRRNTKPNTTNAKPYNHYALLCSMENMFGLTHLGFAGAPGLACFGKDVYNKP